MRNRPRTRGGGRAFLGYTATNCPAVRLGGENPISDFGVERRLDGPFHSPPCHTSCNIRRSMNEQTLNSEFKHADRERSTRKEDPPQQL